MKRLRFKQESAEPRRAARSSGDAAGQAPAVHVVDLIQRKRDGDALSAAEIQGFVAGVVSRTISDAQAAAMLMAMLIRGLQLPELTALTEAMRVSGTVFDWSGLGTTTVDKHSTGGVGDKTSLLLGPILAAAGVARRTPAGVPGLCVPMISGRSLGHTGGTLDKLESIPGFNTQQPVARVEQLLRTCGCALVGQTPDLVPADRILYALRDHTGTVESPYLITASIMSKKLAEDLDALVLDVKTGSGAFLRTDDEARGLAQLLVETGAAAGTRTVALLTRMDEPLGRYAGNWLEVLECVDIMQGVRHRLSADLVELTLALAGSMLHLAGAAASPEAGAAIADKLLGDGSAYASWLAIVEAQGGDTRIFDQPRAFHKATSRVLVAEANGWLQSVDCRAAGWAVQRLGAGRSQPGGPVSAHAGLEVHARIGDRITAGQPLVTLFAEDEALLAEPHGMLREAYRIADAAPIRRSILVDLIRPAQA